MIEKPHVLKSEARKAAVIHVTVARELIRDVMGPGLDELLATLTDQYVPSAGPWYTHHFGVQPDKFDFEIGVPVNDIVFPTGRVRAGVFLGGKVARTVFHGDYSGLPGAWSELDDWIARRRLKPSQDFWEVYVVGPQVDPDPAHWRTELNRPLLP